jgi:hypothetical protein
MKITATLQVPRLDINRYKRQLADDMTAALTNAAFEWVLAATAEIPVWSGASHATFLQLSREIGFQLSISEAGNAPNRVSYGLRHSDGVFITDPNAGRFAFHYETDLKHLVYNEYNNANVTPDPGLFFRLLKPGPYHFQEAARAAYSRAMGGVTLPDLRKFIKVKIKRVR